MTRIDASDVKLGIPLACDVFDHQANLLLARGDVFDQQASLDALLERGLFVLDDDFSSLPSARMPHTGPVFNPFWLWDDIFSKLVYVLKHAATEDLFEDKAAGISLLLISLADTDPDAALASILLKDGSRYAYAHSLHVAVLAALISRRLAWSDEARRDLVLAALTMNVAMVELQTALLHQKEPLSEDQRRDVHTHPQKGVQLLRSKGIVRSDWLEGVRLHHEQLPLEPGVAERANGRTMSQLLRVLDVFCAKISSRTYRRAIQPPVAAREIFVQERRGASEFVDILIKEIGLYMPGTFVKLENGETSLVVKRGASVNAPTVISLSRGDGAPFLEITHRDTAIAEFAVKTVVPREKIMHMLNLSKIWGY